MSGGSYNYLCFQIEEEYVGRMHDIELDDMMKDLAKLLHDLEWWQSSDTSEESYRKTVKDFKEKWFKGDRNERLKTIIEKACDDLKTDLLKLL